MSLGPVPGIGLSSTWSRTKLLSLGGYLHPVYLDFIQLTKWMIGTNNSVLLAQRHTKGYRLSVSNLPCVQIKNMVCRNMPGEGKINWSRRDAAMRCPPSVWAWHYIWQHQCPVWYCTKSDGIADLQPKLELKSHKIYAADQNTWLGILNVFHGRCPDMMSHCNQCPWEAGQNMACSDAAANGIMSRTKMPPNKVCICKAGMFNSFPGLPALVAYWWDQSEVWSCPMILAWLYRMDPDGLPGRGNSRHPGLRRAGRLEDRSTLDHPGRE